MTIGFRAPRRDEAELIYRWRTDARTVRYWHDRSSFDLAAHLKWFDRVTADPKDGLWLGLSDGAPVGVLRLVTPGDAGEVGIYLDPERAGRGLGTALLKAFPAWCRVERPAARRLVARIDEGNAASRGAFRAAGFSELPFRVAGGLSTCELCRRVALALDKGPQAAAVAGESGYVALWRDA